MYNKVILFFLLLSNVAYCQKESVCSIISYKMPSGNEALSTGFVNNIIVNEEGKRVGYRIVGCHHGVEYAANQIWGSHLLVWFQFPEPALYNAVLVKFDQQLDFVILSIKDNVSREIILIENYDRYPKDGETCRALVFNSKVGIHSRSLVAYGGLDFGLPYSLTFNPAVNLGNSGGVVLSRQGHAIGIIQMRNEELQGTMVRTFRNKENELLSILR